MFIFLAFKAHSQLIINEVSQGIDTVGSGKTEYWELVVTGSPNCSTITCADIRGWIMDDNNGWHSGIGITPGCLRFANHFQWSCIPPGSIIVIYNDTDRNPKIPPDDPSDANGDLVYILSSSSNLLEKHTTQPSSSTANYPTSGFSTSTAIGSNNTMVLNNSGDCIQLISPANSSTSFQSIGWGTSNVSNNVFFANSTQDKVMFLNTFNTINDPLLQTNWQIGTSNLNETPGTPNTPSNSNFINNLKNTDNNNYQPIGTTVSITKPSCPGVCNGSINVAGTGGFGNYLYTWATTPTYYTSTLSNICPGNFHVKIKDAAGCLFDTVINVNGFNMNVSVNPDTLTFCEGESKTLIASGAQTYTWTPNNNIINEFSANPTISPTASTTYTLVGSSANCKDTVYVRAVITPKPSLVTLDSINMCTGTSKTLSASGATQYTWLSNQGVLSTSGSSVNISPITSNTYTVIGVSNNCKDTALINVTVDSYPSITANAPLQSCSGNSISLTASGANNFSWIPTTAISNPFSGNTTANPTNNIIYSAIGYNGICADTDYVSITILSSPNLQFWGDTIFCTGEQSNFNATGATTYSWQPSTGLNSTTDSSIIASPVQSIVYTLIGSINSCSDTIIFKTYVSEKANLQASNINYCYSSSGQFNAGGAANYSWFPSTGLNNNQIQNPTCNINTSTNYTIIGNNDCPNTEDTLIVTAIVNPKPNININASTTGGCLPLTVNFTSNTPNQSQCFWAFNNEITCHSFDTILTFNSGNTVNVSYWVKDINGCTNDTMFYNYIDLYDTPVSNFNFIPESPVSVLKSFIEFENLSLNANSYYWILGEHENSTEVTPIYAVKDTGTYLISLITHNGSCSDTLTKTIIITDENMVYIPNSFTPNEDQLNETFKPIIRGFNTNTYELKIFNRWGNLILNTQNYFEGWDGTFQDKNAPSDIYIYKLSFSDLNGNKKEYKGTLNLVR